MKNQIYKSAIIIFLLAFALSYGYAKEPTYTLTIQNLNNVSSNTMEFDIYLQHTNSNESNFYYVLGQYFFDFNPAIANGGNLNYSVVNSDLPQGLVPRNPTVTGNQLRLAMNSIGSKDNLPVVADKAPGTLIAKIRLETSVKSFSDAPIDLKIRTGPENPFTKVFTSTDNKIIDITNKEEIALDNNTIVNPESNQIPKEYSLKQNYPNPFNPSTSIKFDIPDLTNVKLSVFDITGRELAVLVNEQLQPGSYDYKWNASQLASGIYFYKLQTNGFSQVKKMMLVK